MQTEAMSENNVDGHGGVLVAVVPGQPVAVLQEAVRIASELGLPLVCANVYPENPMTTYVDGTVLALPLVPQTPQSNDEPFDPTMEARVRDILDPSGIRYSLCQRVGEPAASLARLAEEMSARFIVVGTREQGFRGTLREFFNGSVAATLAHSQHRPIVVVPLPSTADDSEPEWRHLTDED